MTVVASYVYKDGRRAREAPLTDEGLTLQAGEYLWAGLTDPTDDELSILVRHFGFHPLAVEDTLMARQMPKLEVYKDDLFVVARTAHAEEDEILYGETHIFVGRNYVVTIRHGSARAHTQLRAQLEASPVQLRHGPDFIVHAVLDFIVDGYVPIIDGIEDRVLEMEGAALEAGLVRADIKRLFQLRRELLKFSRVLGPMEEVCTKLQSLDLPCIDKEVRPYFRDVADHVRRVASRTAVLRDILSSVFELSNLLEQQRQGVITRKLAAWAAILATPTAIAGIYGMNFAHMPELQWVWGYPAVMGVIAVICLVLYANFKRNDWL